MTATPPTASSAALMAPPWMRLMAGCPTRSGFISMLARAVVASALSSFSPSTLLKLTYSSVTCLSAARNSGSNCNACADWDGLGVMA